MLRKKRNLDQENMIFNVRWKRRMLWISCLRIGSTIFSRHSLYAPYTSFLLKQYTYDYTLFPPNISYKFILILWITKRLMSEIIIVNIAYLTLNKNIYFWGPTMIRLNFCQIVRPYIMRVVCRKYKPSKPTDNALYRRFAIT